jgi:hypothetical protein
MKKNKKQLHEALAVLLTKLSSARDNPLLMDNYAMKALRTVLLDYKESGELHEAYKEQIQSTLESDNPWVAMMMKSIGADTSIKKSMTDEAIDGMIDSMLGNKQRDNLQGRNHRGYSLFGKYGLCGLLPEGNQDRERLRTVCYCRSQ